MELSSPNIVKGGNSMSASCMAAPLWWHRQRVMIHTVHLVSKILQNLSDFAEIWTHNTVQHEETENGICKPFCQNPSVGFTKYYYFLVSNSHYCWCKQFWSQLNGWFIRYEWWNRISKNWAQKLLTSTVMWIWYQKVVVFGKTNRRILAKWFANSIFGFLMLNCIMCSNFS